MRFLFLLTISASRNTTGAKAARFVIGAARGTRVLLGRSELVATKQGLPSLEADARQHVLAVPVLLARERCALVVPEKLCFF